MPEVTRSIEIQAPPSAVWRWLSSPEALRQWLSPTLEIDLRVGGAYLHVWRNADGNEMTMRGVYHEVVPPERVVRTEAFAAWNQITQDWKIADLLDGNTVCAACGQECEIKWRVLK